MLDLGRSQQRRLRERVRLTQETVASAAVGTRNLFLVRDDFLPRSSRGGVAISTALNRMPCLYRQPYNHRSQWCVRLSLMIPSDRP